MDEELTRAMAELAAENGICLVATTGLDGFPHLDSVLHFRALSELGRVSLLAWFSRQTVENLGYSQCVSVSVLDARTGGGFQALGAVEAVEARAYLGGLESTVDTLASVELELRVRLESVHALRPAPHLLLRLGPLQLSRSTAGVAEAAGESVTLTRFVRQTYPC